VASLDEVPGNIEAGESYALTYTILQHGKTPVDVGASSVFIRDSQGVVTEFKASPTGEVGRYAVTVTFPAAGNFVWEVTMGDFGVQQLGAIEVAAEAAAVAVGASSGLMRWLLPTLLALVIGLIAVQVVSMTRSRRVAAGPIRAD
jgi:hypothetical protein